MNLESQNTDPTKVSPFNKRLPLTIGVLEALGIFKSVPGRKNVVFCPSGENLNRAKGIRDARIRKALPNQNETKELVQKVRFPISNSFLSLLNVQISYRLKNF